jgi:hypothetical protein
MTVPLLFLSFAQARESGGGFIASDAVFRFFRFACLHFPRECGKVLDKTGCRGYPGGNADRDHAPETSNNEGETS